MIVILSITSSTIAQTLKSSSPSDLLKKMLAKYGAVDASGCAAGEDTSYTVYHETTEIQYGLVTPVTREIYQNQVTVTNKCAKKLSFCASTKLPTMTMTSFIMLTILW